MYMYTCTSSKTYISCTINVHVCEHNRWMTHGYDHLMTLKLLVTLILVFYQVHVYVPVYSLHTARRVDSVHVQYFAWLHCTYMYIVYMYMHVHMYMYTLG